MCFCHHRAVSISFFTMSTGAPFIGSKISLISNAEIRYEGILYQVDTNESTVTLAKGIWELLNVWN